MAEHKIVHWELMGSDGDKLAAFYGDLFGWNLAPSPGFDAYNMTDPEETGTKALSCSVCRTRWTVSPAVSLNPQIVKRGASLGKETPRPY